MSMEAQSLDRPLANRSGLLALVFLTIVVIVFVTA